MKVFFTSDTHFDCPSVLKYRYRPFSSVREMNEEMVRQWNLMIAPNDTVYHLGDVAVTNEALEEYLPRLNGNKHLIMGNHDVNKDKNILKEYFTISTVPMHIRIDDMDIWICHYPLQRHEKYYTVCGHIHDLWKTAKNMLNVSVDAWHFKPVSFIQVYDMWKAQEDGHFDANVYPDAPLDWQWYVSNIKPRDEDIEPTIHILKEKIEKE